MATAAKASIKDFVFEWGAKDRNGKIVREKSVPRGENQVQALCAARACSPPRSKRRHALGQRSSQRHRTVHPTDGHHDESRCAAAATFDIVGARQHQPQRGESCSTISVPMWKPAPRSMAAFLKYPLYFDSLYSLVEAGGGPQVFWKHCWIMAVYMERPGHQGKIKSALMYPISVVIVAFVVVAVIMIFVIPAFKEVFTSFGADLPAPTLFVMGVSDVFVKWWWPDLLAYWAVALLLHAGLEAQRKCRCSWTVCCCAQSSVTLISKSVMALDAYALTMFATARTAGRSAGFGRRRCRQFGVCHATDKIQQGLHRHQPDCGQ